jgi:HPr kinase/phosphorylase
MSKPATVRDLYQSLKKKLALRWIAGKTGESRTLRGDFPDAESQTLVGPLNCIHPNRIQIIGPAELEYLASLGKNSHQDAMDSLYGNCPAAILISNSITPGTEFSVFAERTDTPLLGSAQPDTQVMNNIQYYLSQVLADRVTVHGVFMEVMGVGVLLTGDSAVGKSELALELISRGHRLIADDAPEFAQTGPDLLTGTCPDLLREFLEVRGLGILNIRAMFGESAIKESKYLRLVINLKKLDDMTLGETDRLGGSYSSMTLLDVDIPRITVPVAPGRNLAILVEGAVRNHILRRQGYDAAEDFAQRQRQCMDDMEH